MNTVIAMCLFLAAAPATQPTSKPARTWNGVAGILRLVPAGIVPAKREHWTDLKAEAANKAMSVVDGDTLVVSMKVTSVGRVQPRGDAEGDRRGEYFVRAAESDGPWLVVMYGYFDADAAEVLSRVESGQVIRVSGTLEAPRLLRDTRGWFVALNTRHSKILAAPKKR